MHSIGRCPSGRPFWTETGQYVTVSGERIGGRDAIQTAFESLLAERKGFRLEATTLGLDVAAPNVALEEGAPA